MQQWQTLILRAGYTYRTAASSTKYALSQFFFRGGRRPIRVKIPPQSPPPHAATVTLSRWRSGNCEAPLIRPVPLLAIVMPSYLGTPLGGFVGFGPGFVDCYLSGRAINLKPMSSDQRNSPPGLTSPLTVTLDIFASAHTAGPAWEVTARPTCTSSFISISATAGRLYVIGVTVLPPSRSLQRRPSSECCALNRWPSRTSLIQCGNVTVSCCGPSSRRLLSNEADLNDEMRDLVAVLRRR